MNGKKRDKDLFDEIEEIERRQIKFHNEDIQSHKDEMALLNKILGAISPAPLPIGIIRLGKPVPQ